MSPQVVRDDVWVSDEESICEGEPLPHKKGNHSLRTKVFGHVLQSWQKRALSLSRVGARGNKRPPIGQMCLVMTGKVSRDQGQVGLVARHTPCMVEVLVSPENGAQPVSYMKKPSSLIMLEAGLVLVQDDDGIVWIRRES
jgi:hypothetical protein